jgi:hypothetical protein
MSDSLPPYEKLGAFYLGRPYDLERKMAVPEPLLYDSRDLVTHALVVGMTGSGKTGLTIALLEEAALDGVPALVVDPKGDLGNLLLTFPELRPEDFAPWVDPEEARRKGRSVEEHAAEVAGTWREGLAAWDQSGERIARLREAADFAIYTPGSEAGLPVSILASLAAPPAEVLADGDLLRERAGTLVASLLTLLGRDADPVKSRDHVLLSTVFDAVWRAGQGLDLAGLIQAVQRPPVERVGVLDLETFYPAAERFELAMALNNLLAAPGFRGWLTGEPLEVGSLLHTATGKPRIAVFSLAHLGDAERMFFMALLLNQTLGWMRSRPGTSSLRALLVIDEIFGFAPPVAEPPSKRPLLSLFKQARAFGLGVVVATQNPVDLDYKGLGNIGTWVLGRLQTERDRERLLDGLQGTAGGSGFDRAEVAQLLGNLEPRVFLLRNVHEDEPVVFQSRWAMSYLRGPLTRVEIQRLMGERRKGAERERREREAASKDEEEKAQVGRRQVGGGLEVGDAGAAGAGRAEAPSGGSGPMGGGATGAAPGQPMAGAAGAPRAGAAVEAAPAGASPIPPVLPPEIDQVFLPASGSAAAVVYRPALFAQARIHFVDVKRGLEHMEEVALVAELAAGGVDWFAAEELPAERAAGASASAAGAAFAPLPAAAARARSYAAWRKALEECLYRTRRCALLRSAALGEVSRPGESEREFRVRLAERARERRDEEVARLRERHGARVERLEERRRRAAQAIERERGQVRQQRLQAGMSIGTAVLGAVFGRKRLSVATLSRAGSAARGVGRTVQEGEDVERAEENLRAVEAELRQLESELAAEVEALGGRFDAAAETLEPLALKPRKADVEVHRLALAWLP